MLLNLKKFLIIFLVIFSVTSFASISYLAAGNDNTSKTGANNDSTDAGAGIANVLCNVISVAKGATGKTIATLVIISMAIGLFLGKITWGVAIAVAVGMGILFGADNMVEFISGGTGDVCPGNDK
jgi:type IV secretion system protein VirB2